MHTPRNASDQSENELHLLRIYTITTDSCCRNQQRDLDNQQSAPRRSAHNFHSIRQRNSNQARRTSSKMTITAETSTNNSGSEYQAKNASDPSGANQIPMATAVDPSMANKTSAAPVTAKAFGKQSFGRKPQNVVCPACQAQMCTRTKSRISDVGVVSSVCTCLVFWPLAWVPLVLRDFKTIVHRCSKCDAPIGSAKPFAKSLKKARQAIDEKKQKSQAKN